MSIFLEIQTKVFSMKQNDVKICFRLLQQKKEEEKRDKRKKGYMKQVWQNVGNS